MDLPVVVTTAPFSSRDEAGLYLLRRARTVAAPRQLRLLITATLLVFSLDLVRLQVLSALAGSPLALPVLICELGSYLAIAVLLWRRRIGALTCATVLVASVCLGGTGLEPLLLAVVSAVLGCRTDRWGRAALPAAALFVAGSMLLHPGHVGFILTWFGGAAVVGFAVGAIGARLLRLRDRTGRRLAATAAEDARLRADERRLLARELHDVIAHQLSNVSLQVMGHEDSQDPRELHRALRRIDAFADDALTELRLLVRVLRDDPTTAAGANEVAELSQRVPPTIRAAHWARSLSDAGLDPVIEIPAAADRLSMTVQQTIARTLDVCGENMLRHAPAGCRCSITLSINDTQLVLRAANPLPTPSDEPDVLGWGLRGLRERVNLTHGQFSAGASSGAEPEWLVVVTVPHDTA